MAWLVPAFMVAIIIDALHGHKLGPLTTIALIAASLVGVATAIP